MTWLQINVGSDKEMLIRVDAISYLYLLSDGSDGYELIANLGGSDVVLKRGSLEECQKYLSYVRSGVRVW